MDFTIADILKAGIEQLQDAEATDTPRLDAELLLCFVMQRSRASLLASKTDPINEFELKHFKELMDDRARLYPVAYMTGEREFWSMMLTVNEKVLIPRADTELLVERALVHCDSATGKLLDLGTGSGAVALALAKELPDWDVVATDFSSGALEIAERNRQRHQLVNLTLQQADWFFGLDHGCFDLVVSNPPYIDPLDPHLESEVRYEPQGALVAMDNGLSDLKFIINEAPGYLNPNGWLLLEHGFEQAEQVRAIMAGAGMTGITTSKDLGGNDRVTEGQFVRRN